MSTDDLQVHDIAVLTDVSLESHHPLNAGLPGERRIHWVHPVDQDTRPDVWGYVRALRPFDRSTTAKCGKRQRRLGGLQCDRDSWILPVHSRALMFSSLTE